MSRAIRVADKAVITYKGSVFNTDITGIQGSQVSVLDPQNKITTSITWNGQVWLLPGNIAVDSVVLQQVNLPNVIAPVISVRNTSSSSTSPIPFILPEIPIVTATVFTPTTVVKSPITVSINTAIGDFPYKRTFMTDDEVKKRFANLSNYNFSIIEMPYTIKRMPKVNKALLNFGGKQLVINTPTENYDLYDNLSDYFQEPARMNCKRSDQTETPFQYWQTHQTEIQERAHELAKTLKGVNTQQLPTDSIKNLREAMYQLHYECTTFKPSLLVGFIKYLGSKRILDISSGYGDRLIAAMAMNDKIEYYVGVDPNSALFPGYKSMIDFFISNIEDRKKYIMIESEFEKAILPNLTYDLVYTSPPFYDLEEYANKNQSYIGRTPEQWYNDFLIFSLKKAWSYLEKNGFMVLYINDTRGYSYTERMVNEILTFPGAQYIGCLPQSDIKERKNINPHWCFKKN